MMRSAARYPASKNTQRTLQRLLNAAGIDARGVVFLVELFANTSSAFTREVAARGGYSVRVCLPRSRTRRKGVRRRGTSTKRGRYLRKRTRPPPTLVRGRSYTWPLNLSVPTQRQQLLDWLKEVVPPPGVTCFHLHSSPPCTGFSRTGYINVARGHVEAVRASAADGVSFLSLSRAAHGVFKARKMRPLVRISQTHEAAAGATAKLALRLLPTTAHLGVRQEWPWAISPTMSRVTVRGCAVGLRDRDGTPCAKRWTFECSSGDVLRVLQMFRKCPGCREHVNVLSETCARGYGASASAAYPPLLAAALTAGCLAS